MIYLTQTRPIFQAYGSVRGYGPRRSKLTAAIRDCENDRKACANLGSGCYSDYAPVCIMGKLEFLVVDPDDYNAPKRSYDRTDILKAIGRSIADGGGIHRPRLKADDWSGWVVAGSSVLLVDIRWPDDGELHEVIIRRMEHICEVYRD